MSKKINVNLVKRNKFYTTQMLRKELCVHIRSIQSWVKQGMKVASNERPRLFWGQDVKNFLKEKQKSRKILLAANEFYCLHCRKAVSSVNNKVFISETGKIVGDDIPELQIMGICDQCGSWVYRISNLKRFSEYSSVFQIENAEEFEKILAKFKAVKKGLSKYNNNLSKCNRKAEENEKN